MLVKGEKVHIITRRFFDGDLRRHFVGEIVEVSGAAIRVRGYAFVFDENSKDFIRRNDVRERIASLIDAGLVINIIPRDVVLEDVRYKTTSENQRVVTDDKLFTMNVSEFGAFR